MIAATSETVAFVAVDYSVEEPVIFSHMVNVLALEGFAHFAIVQSTIHLAWARRYGSSMKGDMRYTTTDCFENFPFPYECTSCDEIGRHYYAVRSEFAAERNARLTDLYYLFHNREEITRGIVMLRDVHVEMDRAVAAAYGWSDLDLGHGFHETKQGTRFTISESARREVLTRLLRLNHERYAEEVAQALHDKGKDKPKGAGRKGKKASTSDEKLLF
jgi:hypothetical protein